MGQLPFAYLTFLRETNGSELGVTDTGGDSLNIWPTEEIQLRNEDYNIQKHLPQCIAIGSDGGDDAILLDRSTSKDPEKWSVVRVCFASLDTEEFVIQAKSFSEWATNKFQLTTSPPPEFDLPTQEEISKDVDEIIANFPEGDEPF